MENALLPLEYAYLAGALALCVVWSAFFFVRKDVRKEMLVMSALIGVLSVVTAQYWWTVDWWRPATMTGTKIGIEDFLTGFASGGIMAVVYEVLFRKRLSRTRTKCSHCPGPFTILLLLALLTSWFFWGVGITSFWASTMAMAAAASLLLYFRRDLFINGLLSGILMAGISLVFYATILLLSPGWVAATYQFETLSGFLVFGIPIEEFVFWFLAGLVFGPFYEYWKEQQLVGI